jgi:hypothetical protein
VVAQPITPANYPFIRFYSSYDVRILINPRPPKNHPPAEEPELEFRRMFTVLIRSRDESEAMQDKE